MVISSLPAPVDFQVSRLDTFRKPVRWPAPLNTAVGWAGWEVEFRLDRQPVLNLTNAGLIIDSQGRLILSIPAATLSKMGSKTGYDLVFIAPDGTKKNYWSGQIILTR